MSGDLTTRINFAVQQGTLDLAGNPVRTPAIPTIPQDCPPGLRGVISAMKQIIDVREGNNPNQSPLDHGLTLRDLVDQGLFAVNVNGNRLTGGARSAGSAVVPAGFTDSRPVLMTPPTLTALAAQGAFKSVILTWAMLAYANHAYVEIWRATSNALGAAVLIGTSYGSPTTDPAVVVGASYFYWVRAVNIAGTAGAFNAVLGTSAALLTIGSSDLGPLVVLAGNLAAGAVDLTKFGAGLEPVSVVGALPTPVGYAGAHTLFLTTDKKLYRYNAATPAWTKATDGADITANSITAGQILAGTLTATELAANSITAAKLAANSIAVGTLAVQNGAIVNAMIANLTVDNAKIASLDGAKINAGTIVAGSIAANTITAAQIAANTITAGQIAANSITAGQIDSRGLSIKDPAGNVILASGSSLDFSTRFGVGTAGVPANGATVGGNMIVNGGFEGANGTANWKFQHSGNSAGVSLYTTTQADAVSGTQVLNIYNGGGVNGQACVSSSALPVAPGATYMVRFRYRATVGTFTLYPYVGLSASVPPSGYNGYPDSGLWTSLPGPVPITVSGTAWQTFEQPYTIPAGYYWLSLELHNWQPSTAGAIMQIDAVEFVQVNPITPANVSTFIAAAAIGTAQVGTLNASVITAGTITTDRLVANAATAAASGSLAGSTISIPANSYGGDSNPINVTTLTTTGAPVTVVGYLQLAVSSGSPVDHLDVSIYLYADGGALASTVTYTTGFSNGGGTHFDLTIPLVYRYSPTAASHTFQVRAVFAFRNSSGSAITSSTASAYVTSYLTAQENKV